MPAVRGVLLDLDGVVYDAEDAIPGAAEAVAWLASEGVPHLFVSNTTSRPRAALVAKLARFGVAASGASILTPPAAAAAWLRAREGAVALFVPEATRAEFEGLPLLDDGAEEGAAHVVVGDLGARWDYATLNRAFRLLHHAPDATLVALGMTRYWNGPAGLVLDVAPFVVALAHASGREPVVLGKPSRGFYEAAARRLGLAPSELLMVGDDVVTDVGGAQDAGLRAALVRTGKFRPSDLERGIEPDVVLDSLAALPSAWPGLS